jgi:ribosomal protein S11
LPIYVFLKFVINNIFINIYVRRDRYYLPIIFRTYGQQVVSKSKWAPEDIKDFAESLALYLKKLKDEGPVTIIFKGFGKRFRKHGQSVRRLDNKRRVILRQLIRYKINVIKLIDDTAIPYNGCKSKSYRRRKLKHVRQFKQDPS